MSKKVVSILMVFLFIALSASFSFAAETDNITPILIDAVNDPPIASKVEAGSRLSASTITGGAVKHPTTGEPVVDAVWKWQSSRTKVEASGMYPAYCMAQGFTYPLMMDIYVGIIGDALETSIETYPTIDPIIYKPNLLVKDLIIKGGKAVVKDTADEVAGKFIIDEKYEKVALEVGTFDIAIKFVPDDSEAYLSKEISIPVTVNKGVVKFVDESGNEIVPEIVLDKSLTVSNDLRGYLNGYLNVPSSLNFEETEDYGKKIKPGTHEYTVKTICDDKNYERYNYLKFKVIANREKAEAKVQGKPGSEKIYFENDSGSYVLYGTFDVKYFIDGKEAGVIKDVKKNQTFSVPRDKSGVYTYEIVYKGTADDYYDVTVIAPPADEIKLKHNVIVNGVTTEHTYGEVVDITAPANEKPYYVFAGWNNSAYVSAEEEANESVSFIMPDSDVELQANYEFSLKAFFEYIFSWIVDFFEQIAEFLQLQEVCDFFRGIFTV